MYSNSLAAAGISSFAVRHKQRVPIALEDAFGPGGRAAELMFEPLTRLKLVGTAAIIAGVVALNLGRPLWLDPRRRTSGPAFIGHNFSKTQINKARAPIATSTARINTVRTSHSINTPRVARLTRNEIPSPVMNDQHWAWRIRGHQVGCGCRPAGYFVHDPRV